MGWVETATGTTHEEVDIVTMFQSICRKLFSPQVDIEDIHTWRERVLSIILFVVVVLGSIVAVPSVLLALNEGLWPVAAIDVIALFWVVIVWRNRAFSFRLRAWNFVALLYLLGLSFLFTVGPASQIYLMAFPVMAALLLGLRPALFALFLNAVTLLGVGYLVDADLHIAGLQEQPLLKWIVITINFIFVNSMITISSAVLLHGLEKSLERKRESEELYRATFENAPVGVSQLDLDGRWLQVNRMLCDITGYSRDEMLGLTYRDITHPEDLGPDITGTAALIRGEIHSLNREKRYIRKDGSTVWVHLRTSLVRAASGEPRHLVAVATDITERRQADKDLRIRDNILRTSLNAIAMSDLHGRLTFANEAFLNLWGFSSEKEVLDKPAVSFWTVPNDAQVVVEALLGGSRHWRGQMVGLKKNGESMDVEVWASVATGTNGEPLAMMASFMDITERKRAENELRKLNETLEEKVAERTRELEAFSYSVAHDLRAPLRAIDGYSKLVLSDNEEKLDSVSVDYLQRVRAASQRLGDIIDDLLELSQVSRTDLKKQNVDLARLSAQIVKELREREPEREVILSAPAEITAQADPFLARILLDNLLGNAWKYTSKVSPARIEFGKIEQSGETVYFVRDNGSGFDMAYADKLFQPFQRLHRRDEFEGTGIGLSIVHRIVSRHEGKVWAEAKKGEGATFFFTLG